MPAAAYFHQLRTLPQIDFATLAASARLFRARME
jgi:hypothetical protein